MPLAEGAMTQSVYMPSKVPKGKWMSAKMLKMIAKMRAQGWRVSRA